MFCFKYIPAFLKQFYLKAALYASVQLTCTLTDIVWFGLQYTIKVHFYIVNLLSFCFISSTLKISYDAIIVIWHLFQSYFEHSHLMCIMPICEFHKLFHYHFPRNSFALCFMAWLSLKKNGICLLFLAYLPFKSDH